MRRPPLSLTGAVPDAPGSERLQYELVRTGYRLAGADRDLLLRAFERRSHLGDGGVIVLLDSHAQLLQVRPQLVVGRTAPEPVADVDLLDFQARPEHQRVRDSGGVVGVGVLLDVKRSLHLELLVAQERPEGTGGDLELVRLVGVVW